MPIQFRKPFLCYVVAFLALALVAGVGARASDHGDTPLLKDIGRHDARVTGLHAFSRGGNLVLAVGLDPTVPPGATEYVFAPDLAVDILIDNDSAVTFDDPGDLADFGGTIVNPGQIKGDIVFKLRFDEGAPSLKIIGLSKSEQEAVEMFAGLRDDPFIRTPRIGKNVAAIVLEVPLSDVLNDQSTLLIWATSKAEDIRGRFQDLAGRALRNQFPALDALNTLHPKDHLKSAGVSPDVVIYDTSVAASFPNGLELTDDVVDLLGLSLPGESPSTTTNDVPFLSVFPYLAPPQ